MLHDEPSTVPASAQGCESEWTELAPLIDRMTAPARRRHRVMAFGCALAMSSGVVMGVLLFSPDGSDRKPRSATPPRSAPPSGLASRLPEPIARIPPRKAEPPPASSHRPIAVPAALPGQAHAGAAKLAEAAPLAKPAASAPGSAPVREQARRAEPPPQPALRDALAAIKAQLDRAPPAEATPSLPATLPVGTSRPGGPPAEAGPNARLKSDRAPTAR